MTPQIWVKVDRKWQMPKIIGKIEELQIAQLG